MSRALLIQLARLGDLVQSLPVLTSLHAIHSEHPIDLLCPSPLVSLGELFPCLDRVYSWRGEQWHELATRKMLSVARRLEEAKRYLAECAGTTYTLAYNLNNHPRGILAAHLFSDGVMGPGENGPLSSILPAWAGYLRQIAQERGDNRVHLADAFCGMCRVLPPSDIPNLQAPMAQLPYEWERIVNSPLSMSIGIVLGAGDADRRIPPAVWQELLVACAEHIPQSYLFLIGGAGEREAALALERDLPAKYANQVVNGCGRTSLPQLVSILNRCRWVVGSDTGPLHLGAMCGARVIGWYFSRARVHETGPYGVGHYVWQHERGRLENYQDTPGPGTQRSTSDLWPVRETVRLLQEEQVHSVHPGWDLWSSHRDEWGAFYTRDGTPDEAVLRRKATWEALSRLTDHDPQRVIPGQSGMIPLLSRMS